MIGMKVKERLLPCVISFSVLLCLLELYEVTHLLASLGLSGSIQLSSTVVYGVLVMSCNRPQAVKDVVGLLLRYRPSKEKFPIVISQDGNHSETRRVIEEFKDEVTHIQLNQTRPGKMPSEALGYYRISRHYKWALAYMFNVRKYDFVIVVEDDLIIAADFFEYLVATSKILFKDDSLYCVSAWNDNGSENLTENDPFLLHRTDFFPGLGWLLTRRLWQELEPEWPALYWDDWMRHPKQRKGRQCIRPEMSRTSMSAHGKFGVSRNFRGNYVSAVRLSTSYVPFGKLDLNYLLNENYKQLFRRAVHGAPVITLEQLTNRREIEQKFTYGTALRMQYNNLTDFQKIARRLGLMDDINAGVPRTAYFGVIQIFYNLRRIFICPKEWEIPDSRLHPNWSIASAQAT